MPNHGESACQLGSAHAMNQNDLVFGIYNIERSYFNLVIVILI
jgi:hypothetical protein